MVCTSNINLDAFHSIRLTSILPSLYCGNLIYNGLRFHSHACISYWTINYTFIHGKKYKFTLPLKDFVLYFHSEVDPLIQINLLTKNFNINVINLKHELKSRVLILLIACLINTFSKLKCRNSYWCKNYGRFLWHQCLIANFTEFIIKVDHILLTECNAEM
jgi:hypothetical protein